MAFRIPPGPCPGSQTLECIQQVKAALVAGGPGDEDSISGRVFAALSLLSVAVALSVVLVW